MVASALLNFFAQLTNFYAYQQGNVALVSLLGYAAIIYNFIADLIFFDVIPTQMQFIAIVLLVVTNLIYFTYKLRQEAAIRRAQISSDFIK